MHVFFTSIGLALGYGMHRFEENAEEIFKKLVKKHKNASWYPPGVLLAERQARLNALKGVEEAAVEIEGMQASKSNKHLMFYQRDEINS